MNHRQQRSDRKEPAHHPPQAQTTPASSQSRSRNKAQGSAPARHRHRPEITATRAANRIPAEPHPEAPSQRASTAPPAAASTSPPSASKLESARRKTIVRPTEDTPIQTTTSNGTSQHRNPQHRSGITTPRSMLYLRRQHPSDQPSALQQDHSTTRDQAPAPTSRSPPARCGARLFCEPASTPSHSAGSPIRSNATAPLAPSAKAATSMTRAYATKGLRTLAPARQPCSTESPCPSPPSLLDHEVDQLARHNDCLHYGLAINTGDHLNASASAAAFTAASSLPSSHLHYGHKLPIRLHRNLNLTLPSKLFVHLEASSAGRSDSRYVPSPPKAPKS